MRVNAVIGHTVAVVNDLEAIDHTGRKRSSVASSNPESYCEHMAVPYICLKASMHLPHLRYGPGDVGVRPFLRSPARRLLRSLSFRQFSCAILHGTAFGVENQKILVLPWGPAAPEGAFVCSVRAAPDWPATTLLYVGRFRSLRSFHDVELHYLAFSCTLSDHRCAVSRDGFVMDEDILAGVVAVYKAYLFLCFTI